MRSAHARGTRARGAARVRRARSGLLGRRRTRGAGAASARASGSTTRTTRRTCARSRSAFADRVRRAGAAPPQPVRPSRRARPGRLRPRVRARRGARGGTDAASGVPGRPAIDIAVAHARPRPGPVAKALLGPRAAWRPGSRPTPGRPATRRGRRTRASWPTSKRLAEHGDPDAALGEPALARLMGDCGGPRRRPRRRWPPCRQADRERDRLMARLAEACARLDPSAPALELCRSLVRDHPDIDGVMEASRDVDRTRHGVHPRARPGALPRR